MKEKNFWRYSSFELFKLNIKISWHEFIFKFEIKTHENRKNISWNIFHEIIKYNNEILYIIYILYNLIYKYSRYWKNESINNLNHHLDDYIIYQKLLKTEIMLLIEILSNYFNIASQFHISIIKK